MKAIVLAACLALVAADALAISQYKSTSMSCASIQGAVRNEGAVVLHWTSPTSGVPRYDSFVRDDTFCRSGFRTDLTTVPAADTKSCRVYHCKPKMNFKMR